MTRIKHEDLVELVKELNSLLGKSTETGGYFITEAEYKPDVKNTIKLYSGGVPGYTLYFVNKNGSLGEMPYMKDIPWARLSTREMFCFLTGLVVGIKTNIKPKK